MNINPKIIRRIRIVVILSVIIFLVLVVLMFYFGEKTPQIIINDSQISIDSMYGITVDFSDISNIKLEQKSMKEISNELHRDDGYSFRNTLKGNFSSQQTGECLLFVSYDVSPTIFIDCTSTKDIYISFPEKTQTEATYTRLMGVLNTIEI